MLSNKRSNKPHNWICIATRMRAPNMFREAGQTNQTPHIKLENNSDVWCCLMDFRFYQKRSNSIKQGAQTARQNVGRQTCLIVFGHQTFYVWPGYTKASENTTATANYVFVKNIWRLHVLQSMAKKCTKMYAVRLARHFFFLLLKAKIRW